MLLKRLTNKSTHPLSIALPFVLVSVSTKSKEIESNVSKLCDVHKLLNTLIKLKHCHNRGLFRDCF